MLPLLLLLVCAIVNGDITDFDCPMRELGIEYATYINPYITQTQLQDIADALNGAPEKQQSNCTIKPPTDYKPLPHKIYNDVNDGIPSIYVDVRIGNDDIATSEPNSLSNPFKTIQAAINFARWKYGPAKPKKILIRGGQYHLSSTLKIGPQDSNLIISNYKDELVNMTGSVPLNNLNWSIYKKNKYNNATIYKTNVNKSITSINGLRINGYRGILARYPNANPELGFGSSQQPLKYIMSSDTTVDYYYTDDNPEHNRNDTNPGDQHSNYQLYFGGEWLSHFTPPASYWNGGVPIGLQYDSSILPNAPYQDMSQLIVAAWRGAHWESWFWDINITQTQKIGNNTLMFGNGGNQGGRSGGGSEFYVMNVMEELDAPNEFFYNGTENVLYYIPNVTEFQSLKYEATQLKTLMEIKGNQSNPVKNVVVTGMNIINSEFTGLDPHGCPSGGGMSMFQLIVGYM